jgi:hypothetical protein
MGCIQSKEYLKYQWTNISQELYLLKKCGDTSLKAQNKIKKLTHKLEIIDEKLDILENY